MPIIDRNALPDEQKRLIHSLNTTLQPLFLTGASTYESLLGLGRMSDAEKVLEPLTVRARNRFLTPPSAEEKVNPHRQLGLRLESFLGGLASPLIDSDGLAQALSEAYDNLDPNNARGQTTRELIEQAFVAFSLPLPAVVAEASSLQTLAEAVARGRSTGPQH